MTVMVFPHLLNRGGNCILFLPPHSFFWFAPFIYLWSIFNELFRLDHTWLDTHFRRELWNLQKSWERHDGFLSFSRPIVALVSRNIVAHGHASQRDYLPIRAGAGIYRWDAVCTILFWVAACDDCFVRYFCSQVS